MKILRDRTALAIIGIVVVAAVIANFFLPKIVAPKPSFIAEPIFSIGPLNVNNSMIMSLIIMALIVILFALAMSKSSLIPGRLQNFAEAVVEMILGLVESTAGKRTGRVIFPLICTLFIFIIGANWLALLPVTWFGGCYPAADAVASNACPAGSEFHSFLRAPNADLNMTLAMALIAFVVIQASGVIAHGAGGYLKELSTPVLLAPIHILGELSRIISLSFRLFGNIFGGEVLLSVMYFLLGTVLVGAATIIFVGLEFLFGMIQALIFSMLTLVYISMAIGGHGDAEGHDVEHNPAGEGVDYHPQSGTEVAMG